MREAKIIIAVSLLCGGICLYFFFHGGGVWLLIAVGIFLDKIVSELLSLPRHLRQQQRARKAMEAMEAAYERGELTREEAEAVRDWTRARSNDSR